ncbi:peptidylprolyl isomerase [Fulvivirga sediminis]|nr:peptidyl-prolyl cis-trans isomerase [Fulvivirga sediminis]
MRDGVSNEEEHTGEPIARVKNQYLYSEDLEGIAPATMSKEDSSERVERFIHNWIQKQLLIQEASTKIEFNEADIERKMLDYKYSLMGYQYQSYYVNKHLDKSISDEEVKQYYDEHIDNFILKQNIIRGKYIKLPLNAPKIKKVKGLINSEKEKDLEELNSYCLSFATKYQLDDSVWMIFDEVIQDSPLAEIPNKVQYLQNQKYSETSDDKFRYYLKIQEFRISDNISPLEFVKEDIRSIIINKRKVELAQQLEDEVYERATQNNEFEIYN